MPEESIMLELSTLRQCHEDLSEWASSGGGGSVPGRVKIAVMRAERLLSIKRVRDAFQESQSLAVLTASVPKS